MPGIRTTTVGSWPIPFGKRPALKRYYAGELDDAAAGEVLQAAARIVMDEQIACGLAQIMGGEVFAPDFVHHVPPRLEGVRPLEVRDPSRGQEGVARYEPSGEISAPRGTGHALAFRRERAIEPALEKAAVPSPLTIAMSLGGGHSFDSQLENLARIVEREVLDMVEAGAGEVQIDAPTEAILAAESARSVEDIARWLRFPFRSVPEATTRTVHFCLGDIARKPSTQIQNLRSLLPLLQALDGIVDRVHLECTHAGQWQDRAVLRDVPRSFEAIAGIADVKAKPESVEALGAKIDRLLEILSPERLLVSSSCGCGRMPHDDAIRLMRNLVKAAHGESSRR